MCGFFFLVVRQQRPDRCLQVFRWPSPYSTVESRGNCVERDASRDRECFSRACKNFRAFSRPTVRPLLCTPSTLPRGKKTKIPGLRRPVLLWRRRRPTTAPTSRCWLRMKKDENCSSTSLRCLFWWSLVFRKSGRVPVGSADEKITPKRFFRTRSATIPFFSLLGAYRAYIWIMFVQFFSFQNSCFSHKADVYAYALTLSSTGGSKGFYTGTADAPSACSTAEARTH